MYLCMVVWKWFVKFIDTDIEKVAFWIRDPQRENATINLTESNKKYIVHNSLKLKFSYLK